MASQPQRPLRFRNLDEYYAYIDATGDDRVPYNGGYGAEPEAATFNHARLCANLIRHVGNELIASASSCSVLDSSIFVMTPGENEPYDPDLTVVCGQPSFWKDRQDTLTNPVSLFEVLSKATRRVDQGENREAYFSIPGLVDYVVVDQFSYQVFHHQRTS